MFPSFSHGLLVVWITLKNITVLPQEHLPKSILRTLPKDLLMEAKASCEQRHLCWLEREYMFVKQSNRRDMSLFCGCYAWVVRCSKHGRSREISGFRAKRLLHQPTTEGQTTHANSIQKWWHYNRYCHRSDNPPSTHQPNSETIVEYDVFEK